MKEIQIFLKFLKPDFIPHFIFTVLTGFLLNSIICQVNVLVWAVLHWKLKAWCSDIPSWVKVSRDTGSGCYQSETADIKLSSMKEKRVDIFLYNESLFRMFLMLFFNVLFNIFNLFADPNSTASVRIFSRFDNPH